MPREVHYQTVVDAAWTDVVAILSDHVSEVLREAPEQGPDHAGGLTTRLSARLGEASISRQVYVEVETAVQPASDTLGIPLRWHAEPRSALFPRMAGELVAVAVDEPPVHRTLLSFHGRSEGPQRVTGVVLEELIGDCLAEDAVQRFVEGVAERIEGIAAVRH